MQYTLSEWLKIQYLSWMLNNIYIIFKQTKIQVDASKTVSNFEVCNLGLQAVNHVNRKKDFE